MGINSVKRKQLRRKYKRRAAALMSAAILTGAALSGIPATKALAAEAPSNTPPQKQEQTFKHSKDSRPPGRGWHQHKHSWPSPDESQAWYQDGKIYYRSTNNSARDYHYRSDYAYSVNNPVQYLKDRAATYGFDAYRDSFSLLSVTNQRAFIEVRKQDTGKLYNVLLERDYNNAWKITSIRAL